eukprot:jgi/Phyca11/509804/fgenesh2_kg.PHYCAscaffold_50_\
MAEGSGVLHSHIVDKMEVALGGELPQMDVRFKNLSLTADIVVVEDDGAKYELPTLPNTVKKAFVGPKKRTVRKEILKDISGVFQPGKLTLLLGQPGSGKSALMKVLSGRFPMAKNITLEGDVTFNSVKREQILKTLPQFAAYVNQRDKHFPTLTVKETLQFAHTFCGGEMDRRGEELLSKGSQLQNLEALELAKSVFSNFPDIVLEQLGLKICQDTIVGDAMMRGISGGERKRVTTGEMEFGMKYASFMDEISTGLDSAATYDIITTQRSIAHTLHKNIVIALLQPSPEVFALFDDVMILNDGELMYHGPCDQVQSYFDGLGFVCPVGRDIADYLLDLGTQEQYRYQTREAPRGGKHPRSPKEFADVFKQSPSSEVFYLFDSLLLLKRGGETVFYGNLGENCRNLIDYFENIPGVAPSPVGYNPATWMLECIGAGVSNSAADNMDFVSYFKNSSYAAKLQTDLAKEGVTTPSPEFPELVFGKKRAANSATQMKFLVQRFYDMYWRTPSYNLTRLVISVFLSLLFGVIFVGVDYASYTGLNSGVGMVFMASLFNAMVSFQSVLPLSSAERASFYRERASQTYNAFWYFVGSTLVELPYCFLSGLIFTAIYYPMVGFQGFTNGVLFWLNLSLLITMQTYFGQFFSYALPSEEVASIIGVLINSICFLFMGFSPPAYAIPSGYKWLYKIVPHRFALSNLVALVFAKCDDLPTWDEASQSYSNVGSDLGCQPMANSPVTVGHITLKGYTEEYFGMYYDDLWMNFGIVLAWIVGFRLLGLLSLRYVNHQKR